MTAQAAPTPTWWPAWTAATITVLDFQRAYQAQIQVYRGAYGGNISEQMLKQLGIDQQILQQMVDEEASLAEAKRRGIDVSDAELEQRILAYPAFNENGQFIGQARYAALLRMQRPPMTIDAVRAERAQEHGHPRSSGRRSRGWVSVPEKDVDQEFVRRNDKVKLEMVDLRRRQVPARGEGGGRRTGALLRGEQGAVPHRREAEDPLRAGGRRRAARDVAPDRARGASAPTTTASSCTRRPSRCAPATSS